MKNVYHPRGKRLLAALVSMIATGTLFSTNPVFALSPPNLDIPVYWGATPDPSAPTKLYNHIGYGGVADIAAAFNYARRHEETRLGLTVNKLGNMVLPSQTVWDGMSDDAKALYLINAERTARAGMQVGVSGLPLAGIESHVDTIAQNYAQLLHDTDTTGHFQPSGNSNIDSPFIRIANGVGEGCKEFLTRAENLAYKAAFSTSPLDATSIPLPVERAIYDWIYDDAGSSAWGHREAVLLQDTPLSAPTSPNGFKNNHGSTTHEGFLGLSRLDSVDYTPFGTGPLPYHYGSVVVMNIFDPVSDASATGCNYDITLRTEDLPTAGGSNHAPVAEDDMFKVQMNGWRWLHPLDNDTDSDGDGLTITDITALPTNGSLDPQLEYGYIGYRPDEGFSGTDTFTYTISDDHGGTDTATVTLEVADYSPTANDDDVTTSFRIPVTISPLDNDTNPLSADANYPLILNGFSEPEHGTVEYGEYEKTLVYTPNLDFSGTDTFTYNAWNGLSYDEGTITVTVGAVPTTLDAVDDNIPPSLFGKPVEFNLLTNDFNPPNTGTISIKSNTTPSKTAGTLTLTKSGSKAGKAKFTPKKGFSGTVSFNYVATNSIAKQTDTASVTITVKPNTPPRASSIGLFMGYEVGVNKPRLIELVGYDDEDGKIAKPYQITQPANGKVAIKSGKYYYTPNKGFVGNDSFTYTVKDRDGAVSPAGTVRLRVTATPSS